VPLDTIKFVEELVNYEYSHLCVVPCSFAKNLINEAINNPNIEYVPAASEAVACSVAAGLKISGKKPIVIVQSSGMTNMASCITSLLSPYEITFPILTSWRTYSEGDSEIQHKHLATYLPNLIEAYGYNLEILDKNNLDKTIETIHKADTNKTVCIIEKGSFDSVSLNSEHILDVSSFYPRSAFLEILEKKFQDSETIFIGTTGNLSREMYSLMPNTKNFYMAGNMGGALSLGLGVAKAGKKVIVCGGDAEFVMHMGGLTSTGRYANEINLIYILFDNEQNKSTGGQNTYQQHLNYIGIAESSGLKCHQDIIYKTEVFSELINSPSGINFFHVKCGLDDEYPRPPLTNIKINKIN